MRTETATLSKTGGRKNNQDAHGYECSESGGCWVVADGLGGHAGGEVASRMAVERVLTKYRESRSATAEFVGSCFQEAHAALQRKAEEEANLAGMRTTLALLVCENNDALWGHVGDSRLYWFRGGKILHQTRDHSVPQMLVDAGKLEPDRLRGHEDQNRLTRALGQAGDIRPVIPAAPLLIQDGDAALLCSDGIWGYVWEHEMEETLSANRSASSWLEEMEKRVLERAEATHDNYTAVAVLFSRRMEE